MRNSIVKKSSIASAKVVHLAKGEIIEITELSPKPDDDGQPIFIGKQIADDGTIIEFPKNAYLFSQTVAHVAATIPALFAYLREARTRNVCLIRGAPANIGRQWTRRQGAGVVDGKDRGDHGFVDVPTRLFFLDGDGIPMPWRDDPEAAVRKILSDLGAPWSETSCVWFFSAKHGLERGEDGRWTGKVSDGKMFVRLAFITDRELTWGEANAFTKIAKVKVPAFEPSVCRVVQPNYIARPLLIEHPDHDPLGDIPTIGRVKGKRELLKVPDDLEHVARWAKAQGLNVDIAEHPDAEAAVRGICSDGRIRQHLLSAVMHLLLANEVDDVTSFEDHAISTVATLRKMVAAHREEIDANLVQEKRRWSEVEKYLDGMVAWAIWLHNHPAALKRKTIKLDTEERVEATHESEDDIREEIYARVARFFEEIDDPNPLEEEDASNVKLLVAPTGSRKSTLMRAAAVRYVTHNPNKSVVILVPRHELGREQLDLLHKEHGFTAAVWRGRHANDPDNPGEKMCQRSEEARKVEAALLNVDHHLCKRGRGEKKVKCPLFDICSFQGQKLITVNIWFAAHEMLVHEMPKAFGDVGLVMIDKSPIDAFMFGIDINDQMVLPLDDLQSDVAGPALKEKQLKLWGWHDMRRRSSAGGANPLSAARKKLHKALEKLVTPIAPHLGTPVPYQSLGDLPKSRGGVLSAGVARKSRSRHQARHGQRYGRGEAHGSERQPQRQEEGHAMGTDYRSNAGPTNRPHPNAPWTAHPHGWPQHDRPGMGRAHLNLRCHR